MEQESSQTGKTTLLTSATAKIKGLYLSAEDLLFNKLPASVGTPMAALLIIAPLALAGLAYIKGASLNKAHPSEYTVMLTNMMGNSGGSGVIIDTNASESIILTNSHVCLGALKKGGMVKLVSGEQHLVTGYVLAEEHDLCVVSVAADLKNAIKLAEAAPISYSEALITGHPSLMPNVITKGHFGGRQVISIIVGVRRCTDADLNNPMVAPYCMFFGIAPIIREYESQIVTATIMRGSSGSAVLNDKNELSGLVFAGNADGLSYAYIVPYEAIRNFLNKEANEIYSVMLKQTPWLNQQVSIMGQEEQMNVSEVRDHVEATCVKINAMTKQDSPVIESLKAFCRNITRDIRL